MYSRSNNIIYFKFEENTMIAQSEIASIVHIKKIGNPCLVWRHFRTIYERRTCRRWAISSVLAPTFWDVVEMYIVCYLYGIQ